MILPFLNVMGQWHVIVNWQPGMKPCPKLHLRPLSKEESEWLEGQLEGSFHELWARLFPTDESVVKGSIPPEE